MPRGEPMQTSFCCAGKTRTVRRVAPASKGRGAMRTVVYMRLMAMAVVLVVAVACSGNKSADFNTPPSMPDSGSASVAPMPGTSGDYLLRPGDKLSVNVLGADHLSGEFPVSADGTVELPMIGQMPAAGRNVNDIQNELVARYSNTINDPQILVSVLNAGK
jgi:protein involved in polysaccharide export with SLBB domain